MRRFFRIALIAVLTASSTAPVPVRAAADVPAALDGHWSCSGTGAPATKRSYFTARAGGNGVAKHPREVFAAADQTEADGRPSTSFEHMTERPDHTLAVESVEGEGTAPPSVSAAAPLRFAGRTSDDTASFTLTYSVNGDTMHRTATRGNAVVADERCTREPAPPVAATCEHPTVPATVLHAASPNYPATAIGTGAKGIVTARVVLDDRSRVVWADVLRSDNPVFDQTAMRSARESTYRTAVRECRPVPAIYLFTVDFTP